MSVDVYCVEVLSTHIHIWLFMQMRRLPWEALDRLVEKMRPAPLVRCPGWFRVQRPVLRTVFRPEVPRL